MVTGKLYDQGESELTEEEIERLGSFDDPKGYVDDISDEELLDDVLSKKPKQTDSYESVIIVDCVPVVGIERLEKLRNVLLKIFSKWGTIVTDDIPVGDDEKTLGYMFIEFSKLEEAKSAAKSLNGYKMDKNHTLLVNLFSDYNKYINASDEWEEPTATAYKDHGNLQSWLLNKECYDQFSVITEKGEHTAVYFNSPGELTTVDSRKHWTESYVRWSPSGSYFCTLHSRGVALWGADKFKQIQRFQHPEVALIDFSPCERYLITFSNRPVSRSETGAAESVVVWDIATGNRKRGFSVDPQYGASWPVLKWNGDGKYFARLQPDAISVYEMPSCGLLDKKSIKIPGVRDFEWSPNGNVIAYWVPELDAIPARVVLIELPSRTEIRNRNLFNVADCKLHWQKSGDYLCVKVDRYTKKKLEGTEVKYSKITYNFELFQIRKKGVPIDTVECKDEIKAFAWEPTGGKFAFIHDTEQGKVCVSFYKLGDEKIVKLKTLENKRCNTLFWCPTGQFIVLAGLRSMQGLLEFVDTSDMTITTPAQEHFMATDVEWDPTGRYVVSAVSWWTSKMDNGFWIWNFQGRLISKHPMDGFCQFLWRPRPPSLLPQAKVREIRKNMKDYTRTFEIQDLKAKSKASKDVLEKRRKLHSEYRMYRDQVNLILQNQAQTREELRDEEINPEDAEEDEEVVEFLVKVDETVIE